MPTIVGILTFMSRKNFKSFITAGPGQWNVDWCNQWAPSEGALCTAKRPISLIMRGKNEVEEVKRKGAKGYWEVNEMIHKGLKKARGNCLDTCPDWAHWNLAKKKMQGQSCGVLATKNKRRRTEEKIERNFKEWAWIGWQHNNSSWLGGVMVLLGHRRLKFRH